MSEDSDRWLARGQKGKLTTIFICDGPDRALSDLRYLEGRGYKDVVATAPDGRTFAVAKLEQLILDVQVGLVGA